MLFKDLCAACVVILAPFSVWAFYHLFGGLPV